MFFYNSQYYTVLRTEGNIHYSPCVSKKMLPQVGNTDWIDQTVPNTFNSEVLDLLRS